MKRPEDDVLEANLRALFARAYAPVRPSSVFRARLANTLDAAQGAPRAQRPRPLARLALAAGLLLALGLGLWAALAWRGPAPVPGRDVSQLALGSGPLRPFDDDESAHGVRFDSGTLEIAVASARASELVHVGAYASLRLERGAHARLEGDPHALRLALDSGRASLERLDAGAAWQLEAGGSRLEFESGALRLERPADAANLLLARVESGSTRLAPHGALLPLQRELRLVDGVVQDGTAALEPGQDGRGRQALASAAAETPAPDPSARQDGAERVLAGRVLRPDGAACTRFTLVALREERLPAVAMPQVQACESADGAFRFALPREGRYALFVIAADCAVRKLERLAPAHSPAPLELNLESGVELRGRVIDAASGASVAGATVLSEDDTPLQVLPFDLSETPLALPARATTDAEGRFVLAHLSSGHHTLRASAAGYAASWSRRVDARADTAPLELALTRGGSLAIALEPPAAGVRLIASSIDRSFQRPCLSYSGGLSDARGELVLEHLAPGLYVVLRAPVQGTSDVRYALVAEGQRAEVRLGVESSGHALAGRALDADGAPLVDVDLMLQSSEHPEQRWSSLRSDAQGRFRFEDLGPGEYSVYAGDLGRHFIELGRVRVDALDVAHDFVLGRGVLRGRLREAAGAAAVDGWLILQEQREPGWEFRGKTQSSPDGAFAFEGLRPGRYRLIALAQSRRLAPAASATLELSPAAPEVECVLALEPGASLELVVRDETGALLPEVQVELRDESGTHWQFSASERTDGSGRFRVPGIAAGRWHLALARPGAARLERTLELAVDQDATVDLVLPKH